MREDKTNEKLIEITITIKCPTIKSLFEIKDEAPDAEREAALHTFWRLKKNAAKRAMDLYPVGSDEWEIYRAKYSEAMKQYNSLFEEVYKRC